MPTTEHTINDALAAAMRATRIAWRSTRVLSSENTGALRSNAGRPDIVLQEPASSPVVIETEVSPGTTVETDARSRLGQILRANGRRIFSTVAVRLPRRLRNRAGDALATEIAQSTDLDMVLFTGTSPEDCERFPQTGWLRGGLRELSELAQFATVPPAVIEQAADVLTSGVSEAGAMLSEISESHPGATARIAEELCQIDNEQTRRMALTIVVNALLFHEILAHGPNGLEEIPNLDELRSARGLTKAAVLATWRSILRINYWPIFDIARRILEVLPTAEARHLLEHLSGTAAALLSNRVMRSHDLTGALFQKLIADRKFLAAFYTTPAAAALLVGLAMRPDRTPGGGSWSRREDVSAMRIGDFACGTGTLLSAAYARLSALHEAAGGDAEALHPAMMSSALVGCDVLPAAAHLTAAMLSGTHPTVKYSGSAIMTMGMGRREDGTITLGSLDLLDPNRSLDLIAITGSAVGPQGESQQELWSSLRHSGFDLVIMNPPFTRSTGQDAERVGVAQPIFAAFQTSRADQQLMARVTQRLLRGTSAHGNAGEASFFLVLADRQLKRDGTLALVMPLSLVSGDAWEQSRRLLRTAYSNIVVISIAGYADHELAFSADTGMGECLVVATKTRDDRKRGVFVTLAQRPSSSLIGVVMASEIARCIDAGAIPTLEDGPVGGAPLRIGAEVVGYALDAPLPDDGPWAVARLSDLSLAQVAYQLTSRSRVWLPGMTESEAIELPITSLANVGAIGPYHADVSGDTSDGEARGPFEVIPLRSGRVPTYPILWSHDADRERNMSFEADSEGVIRRAQGDPEAQALINQKAARISQTASHCHINRDFRFNSQSTCMQFTERPTISGRAWISIGLRDEIEEKALTLWGNSTLGLLLYWWQANKQQAGRGSIGVAALPRLRTLDLRSIDRGRVEALAAIFDAMKDADLLTMHEMDSDPVRHEIDRRVGEVLFGSLPRGALALLREKVAAEPSVVGSRRRAALLS